MSCGQVVPAVLTIVIMVMAGSASAEIPDPGSPKYANNFLGDFITPTVRPGQLVEFSFNVTNPYDDPSGTMTGVMLTVNIYKYATQHETRTVDSDFANPPEFDGVSTTKEISLGEMQMDDTVRIELEIRTTSHTPHGSPFDQSTYFVRFKMEFRFIGNSTDIVLQSRGFFTDEQWNQMVSFETDVPLVNRTYMKSLGVDGLIPDSSFGIKQKIPLWPLGLLIFGVCAVSFAALYSFVMDNPGKFPWLEKRFYYLRGKLRQSWDKLKDRRRK